MALVDEVVGGCSFGESRYSRELSGHAGEVGHGHAGARRGGSGRERESDEGERVRGNICVAGGGADEAKRGSWCPYPHRGVVGPARTAPIATQGRGTGRGMCLVRGVGWMGWTEAGWAAWPSGPRPSGVGVCLLFVLFYFYHAFMFSFSSLIYLFCFTKSKTHT